MIYSLKVSEHVTQNRLHGDCKLLKLSCYPVAALVSSLVAHTSVASLLSDPIQYVYSYKHSPDHLITGTIT